MENAIDRVINVVFRVQDLRVMYTTKRRCNGPNDEGF